MNFIDHTGHIFSIEDYTSYPIGYEYNECPYTFWMSDEYSSQLSVNCFYIKPIRLLIEGVASDLSDIEITIKNSSNYKLLSSKKVQELVSNNKNPLEYIELEYASDEAIEYWKSNTDKDINEINNFSQSLTNDDLLKVNVFDNNYYWMNDNQEKIAINNENDIKMKECSLEDILGTLLGDDMGYLLTDSCKNNEGIEKDEQTIETNIDGLNLSREVKILLLKYFDEELENLEDLSNEDLDALLVEHKELYSTQYIEIDGVEYIVGKESTEFTLIPFYVIGSASEFGTWQTNILIHVTKTDLTEKYCPITIGGTFVDETEELKINAQNLGIKLPKDICRALYNSSFWNESPNMSLWNQKIKEYLLNYMSIYCERGNFQSALSALKWFGYGDKIQLSSLMQTDNEFIEQYILNNFDIQTDVISEFNHFRNSTLVSLSIPAIIESDETNDFDFNKDFWGEGKPKLKNLFDKTTICHYDEGDIDFVKPFYDWTFNELALKLCALKYYYQKFFLPIHLYIHRASLTNQCFANDTKLLGIVKTHITEASIYVPYANTEVIFPESNTIWLEGQNRLIDEDWIEDNNISLNQKQNSSSNYFEITDNCFSVTLRLVNKKWTEENPSQMFYCKFFAWQNEKMLKESSFTICSNNKEYKLSFILYPKAINSNFDINFWLDKEYIIKILCNGNWYEYKFKLAIPELDIRIGKLRYVYDYNYKQFSKFEGNKPTFNTSMHLPEIVSINNISFIDEICECMENENLAGLTDDILADKIYYYYWNDEGNKEILSNGNKTLVKENGKYRYVKDYETAPLNEKISGKAIYSSIYKNIESYVDLYSIQQNIPTNYNFLNKVHVFDLYDSNEEKIKYDTVKHGKNSSDSPMVLEIGKYKFNDNDSLEVKTLYLNIFDENGDWTKDLSYWEYNDNSWKTTTIEKKLFDIYLMHDFDYWYIIMISKDTIGDSKSLDNIKEIYKSNNIMFKLNRSDNKFLIDRMEYIDMNGTYHFNPKDMIVAKLENLDSLAFKLKIGSRWNFFPLALGTTIEDSFESPTNIGILPIKNEDIAHTEGYYNVKVKYSIDNFVNHSQERTTKILISSEF